MKNLFKSSVLFFYFLFGYQILAENDQKILYKPVEFEIPIRVLLDKKDTPQSVNWSLESQSGFFVIAPSDKKRKTIVSKHLHIKISPKKLFLNDKQHHNWDHIFIVPIEGLLKYNGFKYDGIFSVTIIDNEAYLVNHLDLEDYISTVLAWESWPGWPDEVNKVFSICFRSYGIAKVLEQRQKFAKKSIAMPYDIKNTSAHQVYKGTNDPDKFKNIAKETKGLVLAKDNKPILAMFDICCGSIVPSRKKGLNFTQAPYLARNYPCNYCQDYKHHNWKLNYSLKDFERILKHEYFKISNIKEIKITSKDGAGIVQDIKVRTPHRWYSISGLKFKSLFNLKSQLFVIDKNWDTITISGRGHGHLVGLCQQGAHKMVKEGWNYKNILSFYYPKTTLMKLKKVKKSK